MASRVHLAGAMVRQASERQPDSGWILVADADRLSARRLANHFTRQGFRAYQTPLGEEAVLVANSRRISLATIDVALNDIPGTALPARLKPIKPTFPAALTTNNTRPNPNAEPPKVALP